jgi:hypothetical protein
VLGLRACASFEHKLQGRRTGSRCTYLGLLHLLTRPKRAGGYVVLRCCYIWLHARGGGVAGGAAGARSVLLVVE